MIKNLILVAIFGFSYLSFSQDENTVNHSIGLEMLGNAGLYSIFYNRDIASSGKWHLQMRPQLEIMPGSTSDEIPYSLVPIFGFNNQLVFNKLALNLNLSAGLDFSLGPGSYGTRWISAVSVGPKYKFDDLIWGLAYVYFIKEPEFWYMPAYPHSVALSLEYEF